MLRADDAHFAYHRSRPVLAGVSCVFEPGQITAIVGPNGAGKSTFIRLLAGLLPPTRGRVTLDDKPIAAVPCRRRAGQIALVAQRPAVAYRYTTAQVVAFGRHALDGAGPDHPSTLDALDRVGLADRAGDLFNELSIGQQQLAALARALNQLTGDADHPRYLLADEPLSAMDPRHALQARRLLRAQADRGIGVVVVLHDLSMAARLANHAIVLDATGRIAASGQTSTVLTSDTLAPVFGVSFDRVVHKNASLLVPSHE